MNEATPRNHDYRCADACCAEATAYASYEAISSCECEGGCKCCDESRGENCECSECVCGKKTNSGCQCEGKCACNGESRGKNCTCDNCLCGKAADAPNSLLVRGANIDSPEALSAFVTNVVKQHVSSPYRDAEKEQMADALIALATQNFKMHVQMMVQQHGLQQSESIRQELANARLEIARMQAKLEANEMLLQMVNRIHGGTHNHEHQPVFAPQVIHLPAPVETWQAPTRLATPQMLNVPSLAPFDPYSSQHVPRPQTHYGPPSAAAPQVSQPPSVPGPVQPSQHPDLLPPPSSASPSFPSAQLPRPNSETCLPRPVYPLNRIDPAQYSAPARAAAPLGPAQMMTVTPRIIIQEEEEQNLVPVVGGR